MKVTTRHLTADALQFTGTNADEIRAFAGDRFLFADGGRAWVRDSDGPLELGPRNWLTRDGDGTVFVHSERAFSHLWKQAGGPAEFSSAI